jgi:RNA polymerase sigma factor (sigma-70 family)
MEAHAEHALASPPPGRRLPPGLARISDERLARMVARGSERAFVTLYERYSQPLYRYCRSIVGNDSDAQDALQSTFSAALVALRRGARDAPLRPWLFRITHNEAISLLRRRRPAIELTQADEPTAPSALERALERERLTLLVGDLRELGERQRGALLMRELSGLSHAEISLALGISVGAAKQAIFEARRALLDLAEGRAMSCEQMRRMISDGDGRVLRGRRVRGHVRECADCAAFAAAIPGRRTDLQALAPPLAPLAATGILGGLLGTGSTHAGGGAGWLALGATGKSAGTALAAKALVGVAIVTTASVGVTRVLQPAQHRRPAVSRTSPGRGGAAPVIASGRHEQAGGSPSAAGASQQNSALQPNRTVTSGHRGHGHGGGASNANASPARHGASSHTPVRGARRAASKRQGAGKPPGSEAHAVRDQKARSPQGSGERTVHGGGGERKAPAGAGKPASPGNGAALLEPKPAPPPLARAGEALHGPAR